MVTISSGIRHAADPVAGELHGKQMGSAGVSTRFVNSSAFRSNPHVGVTSVCPSYIDSAYPRARLPRLSAPLCPKRLAELIVRAVQHNKNYVLSPWLVKTIPLGKAILPLWLGQMLCDWLHVFEGMRTWVGHPVPDADMPLRILNESTWTARSRATHSFIQPTSLHRGCDNVLSPAYLTGTPRQAVEG